MIITCLDNLEENKFVENHPDKAVIAENSSLDDYITYLKSLDDKYSYVFVPSDKRNLLKENNIRYYAAFFKNSETPDEKNQLRFDKGQTFSSKIGAFEDR